MLVPSTNTNAEPLTAAILRQLPHVEMFVSRFRLPAALTTAIDADVLGESVSLLADVHPDAVAFHGTAGHWTGIDRDATLAEGLASATGAAVGTTATQSMLAALGAMAVRKVSLVYPGSDAVLEGAVRELTVHGFDIVARSTLQADLSNPQIAALSAREVEALVAGGACRDADAVLCLGTNFGSGYLVGRMEQHFGQPFLDSAVTLAWQLVRRTGNDQRVHGWGSLFASC